jgi:hypothetical protein
MSDTRVTTKAQSSHRSISRTAGIFYVLTFVSIPSIGLYSGVKSANYMVGSGSDNAAVTGAVLEMIVGLAGIATAVTLFPMLKKQNESAALGLVAARVLEAATIFVGVAFIMALIALRDSGAGASATATSHALVALYNRVFLVGQSFMPAICDLLLGVLLYKSRLVPRRLSVIGIVGGPILIAGFLAQMFDLAGRSGAVAGLSALPVAFFEFSLGIWLIIKGFDPEAVTELETRAAG